MVSINTSNSGVAMAALRRVNAELNTTQNRIATGYRVNSAKDDSSVWATAAKLRSDVSATDSLKSGLSTAKAQADAGLAALDEISNIFQTINNIVVTAKAAGAATDAQTDEIKALGSQITQILAATTVNGKNVLTTGNDLAATISVADGAVAGSLTYTSATFASETNVALVLGVTDAASVLALDGKVALAQNELAKTAASLSGFSSGVESAQGFLDKLSDIRESAISGLVDADLEKETARLSALQVKQQLAYQAISMTNGSAQNILRLFQ